jgi:hypothetical protein
MGFSVEEEDTSLVRGLLTERVLHISRDLILYVSAIGWPLLTPSKLTCSDVYFSRKDCMYEYRGFDNTSNYVQRITYLSQSAFNQITQCVTSKTLGLLSTQYCIWPLCGHGIIEAARIDECCPMKPSRVLRYEVTAHDSAPSTLPALSSTS